MPTCKRCQSDFPFNVYIDGKKRNLGSRKFCLKCSPFGKHNTRDLTSLPENNDSDCLVCLKCQSVLPIENFYLRKDNKGAGRRQICKKCHREDTKQRYKLWATGMKQKAVDYLGGKCIGCGREGLPCIFDFHHHLTIKNFTVTARIRRPPRITWEELKVELDLCQLLCAICHKRIHNVPSKSMKGEKLREQKRRVIEYLGGKCQQCGYDELPAALDCHHRNPVEKKFKISDALRKWDSLTTELDKCDLLCVICHRLQHRIQAPTGNRTQVISLELLTKSG